MWKVWIGGALIAAVLAYVYHLGDVNGANARAYRAVLAEIAERNIKLKALGEADAVEVPALDADLDRKVREALDRPPTFPLTPEQAAALNRIR